MPSSINANNTTGLVSTADTSGILQLQTNGTTAVTVDDSQRVAFVAGTAALPAITTTGDTNTGIFFPAADTIAFAEGGAEAMRIDSLGSVLVGITTSPSSNNMRLSVAGRSGSVSNAGMQLITDGGGGGALFSNDGAGLRMFSFTGVAGSESYTERARIDSSGNLLVGGTTSPSGSGNLFVATTAFIGTTNADPTFNRVTGMQARSDGRIYTRASGSWDVGLSSTSGTHITFYTDNGARVGAGNISSNGGTTSYNTTSDYRMKENILPMQNALAKVLQLKPVTYTWKTEFAGTNASADGFIAHELQKIKPNCVIGEKDAVDENGNPKYQSMDTSFLVATLTAAIQEQQAIIESLTQRITALEGAQP